MTLAERLLAAYNSLRGNKDALVQQLVNKNVQAQNSETFADLIAKIADIETSTGAADPDADEKYAFRFVPITPTYFPSGSSNPSVQEGRYCNKSVSTSPNITGYWYNNVSIYFPNWQPIFCLIFANHYISTAASNWQCYPGQLIDIHPDYAGGNRQLNFKPSSQSSIPSFMNSIRRIIMDFGGNIGTAAVNYMNSIKSFSNMDVGHYNYTNSLGASHINLDFQAINSVGVSATQNIISGGLSIWRRLKTSF